jgi:hypothetical protein
MYSTDPIQFNCSQVGPTCPLLRYLSACTELTLPCLPTFVKLGCKFLHIRWEAGSEYEYSRQPGMWLACSTPKNVSFWWPRRVVVGRFDSRLVFVFPGLCQLVTPRTPLVCLNSSNSDVTALGLRLLIKVWYRQRTAIAIVTQNATLLPWDCGYWLVEAELVSWKATLLPEIETVDCNLFVDHLDRFFSAFSLLAFELGYLSVCQSVISALIWKCPHPRLLLVCSQKI